MAAKKAEIPVLKAADIGADVERLGLNGSPTQVMKIFTPPKPSRRQEVHRRARRHRRRAAGGACRGRHHHPEGGTLMDPIRVIVQNCVGCSLCVKSCPYDAIALTGPRGREARQADRRHRPGQVHPLRRLRGSLQALQGHRHHPQHLQGPGHQAVLRASACSPSTAGASWPPWCPRSSAPRASCRRSSPRP